MTKMFNYASVLYAVGQVLDQMGAKSIALREEEGGLSVEGFDSDGLVALQVHYTIADLYELIGRTENLREERTTAIPTTGLLHRFLAEHNYDRELVGASS